MTGRMNPLAALFTAAREANEWEREEILQHEFKGCTVFSADERAVIGPEGRLFARRATVEGCPLVIFTWHPKGCGQSVTFWFNMHSVRDQVNGWLELPEVGQEQMMVCDRTFPIPKQGGGS